jgi:hypothetical protein
MAVEHDTWITRVLNVTPPGSHGGGDAQDFASACEAWDAATEAVDGQIAALQSALRGQDDAELREIGEYGLNAVTGNQRVPLLAALMGARGGNAGDRAKLPQLIANLRGHLDADERVRACDENPFDVAVSIRQTLGAALDRLSSAV